MGSRVGAQVPEQKLALGPESPIGWNGSAGSGRAGGVMDAPASTAAESEPGLQMEGRTDGPRTTLLQHQKVLRVVGCVFLTASLFSFLFLL